MAALVCADIKAAVEAGRLPGSWRDYAVRWRLWRGVPVLSFTITGWPAQRVYRLGGVPRDHPWKAYTDEARHVQAALLQIAAAYVDGRAHGFLIEHWFDLEDRTPESSSI